MNSVLYLWDHKLVMFILIFIHLTHYTWMTVKSMGGGGKPLFYCNDITFQTAKYEITIKNILEEQPKLFLNW